MGKPVDLLLNPANDFVRKLAGSDDILRQLQYLPVVDALDREPETVSSAHWNEAPTCSADATLLDAMLKLLSTNAPALSVQTQKMVQTASASSLLPALTAKSPMHNRTNNQYNAVPKVEDTVR